MTLSIKSKLIAILCLILFTGFLCVNLINYFSVKKTIHDNEIYGSLPLTRDNIYSEIQRDLMGPVFVSSLMAHDTFLKDWVMHGEENQDVIKKYLQEIKNKYGYFTSFFISDKTDKYYYYDGLLKTISREDSHDIWYYNFVDLHKEYEITVDANQAANNMLTVFINHRLHDYDNNLLGVVGVGLDLQRLVNLLSAYQVKYDRDIYLVDQEGIIKIYPGCGAFSYSIYNDSGLKHMATELLNVGVNAGLYEFKRGGDDILLTVRYIEELDWFLFVENNQSKSLAGLKKNMWRNMALGLFVSGLVILINILTVNFFQSRLEKMATTDELTGIFNRRAFEAEFSRAQAFSGRSKSPFSVILLDLDRFKNINDSYGHNIGDEVMKYIVDLAKENLRQTDVLARWGGDEFIMLTYGDQEAAVTAAERIRNRVEATSADLFPFRLSISCGVAEYTAAEDLDSVVKRADNALYESKRAGGNKVISAV